jgi:hypothetical protein
MNEVSGLGNLIGNQFYGPVDPTNSFADPNAPRRTNHIAMKRTTLVPDADDPLSPNLL